MPSPTLSSNDLARLLDINVSTVKRWADSGQLECIRTPGGHRRFRLDDVYVFLTAKGFDPRSLQPLMEASRSLDELEDAVLHRRWDWLRDHAIALALSGDVREIVKLFVAGHLAGIQPPDFSDSLICPIVKHMDHEYSEGRVNVADKNLVARVLGFALAEMRTHWQAQRRLPYRAVCASFAHHYHELPAQCMCQVLASEGWSTFPLGSGVPVDALIATIRRIEPHLVCLCVADDGDVAARADCERLHHALKGSGARLALGGPVAPALSTMCDGAVAVLATMRGAVEFARREFQYPVAESPGGA